MKKLRFEDWMSRKGFTYQKLFDRGIVSRPDLLQLVESLGVLSPEDTSVFDGLIAESQADKKKDADQVIENLVKDSAVKKTTRTSRSRSSKPRTTRKKTNIKDTEK